MNHAQTPAGNGAARCTGTRGDGHCDAPATHWVYPPDGKARPIVGMWCEPHANKAVANYRRSLNETWRAVPHDEREAEAHSVLEALGGGAFVRATGARHLVKTESELQLTIARTRGVNTVCVTRRQRGDYSLGFYSVRKRGLKLRVVTTRDGVAAERLAETFTEVTGLPTTNNETR